ncbi:ribokinase [Enterococcus sp. 8G7_MSG3316]|uniref:Ribokinase n=1 Tax=Candidatus Enterococcus testudinis TaxID=1834191 RepID=A0A242AAT6_9ENTE|nr:ribokinase [Enterococcus sp. 8G7_MSG3316]OTN77723.1 ribokinase [Enterococcus sp. 8G7_MSG3316]
MKNILVIGSMSTDFIVKTNTKPNQGETVFGENFSTGFGGKGANQAIAACRLGADVSMMGHVGDDLFGEEIIENLIQNGVSTSYVEPVTHVSSGSAHITLFNNDNSIIVIPGANEAFDLAQKEKWTQIVEGFDLVILQNEIPQSVNETIIDLCWSKRIPVIYNPAPARTVNTSIIDKVKYITPNEHEFDILFPGKKRSEMLELYSNKLIITLGSKGAVIHNGDKEVIIPAIQKIPVDTTGAGDTFNGALAVALMNDICIEKAISFANLAASFSVMGYGAQGGMPTLKEMMESELYEEAWDFEQ